MSLHASLRGTTFIPFSIACIGLGGVDFCFGAFASQWQPVPADLPFYHLLAVINAVFLVGVGALLWLPRARSSAAGALALYFTVWTLTLQLPRALAAPSTVALWLGVAEIGALCFGALAIVGTTRPSRPILLAARIAIGLCAAVFGLSHFVYIGFTANMVPKWIPAAATWAYATGAGHLLAGFSLLSGVWSRAAALALSAMCASFVLLLHLPDALAAGLAQTEWTAVFIALSIAAAAFAVSAAPERGEADSSDAGRTFRRI